MEPPYRERGAALPAEPARPRPQACVATPSGSASWKASTKDQSPEVKLTSDGQIAEAGYGHGV